MDIIDTASDYEEKYRAHAQGYRKPGLNLIPMGFCHWCESETDNRVFCSAECRDDFERDYNLKKKAGKL